MREVTASRAVGMAVWMAVGMAVPSGGRLRRLCFAGPVLPSRTPVSPGICAPSLLRSRTLALACGERRPTGESRRAREIVENWRARLRTLALLVVAVVVVGLVVLVLVLVLVGSARRGMLVLGCRESLLLVLVALVSLDSVDDALRGREGLSGEVMREGVAGFPPSRLSNPAPVLSPPAAEPGS